MTKIYIYIYMGRPLERSGLLNQYSSNVDTCKYKRIVNKVGIIIHEDLHLIYEGDHCEQRTKHSTQA